MKNKKILVVFAVLIVALLALSACNADLTKKALEAYGKVGSAKTITQNISVKHSGEELASEKLVYNMETGKVSVSKDGGAAKEESFDKSGVSAKLSEDSFESLTADDAKSVVTGILTSANAKTLLKADGVEGNVTVTFTLDGENLASLTIAYKTSNGNDVTIVTSYAY